MRYLQSDFAEVVATLSGSRGSRFTVTESETSATTSQEGDVEYEALISELRRTRHLGPKGLQRELLRLHQLSFSTRTIWKVLKQHGVSVLRLAKKPRQPKRYTRPVSGGRIQIDTCKVGKKLYQFMAIDDCTRMRVFALYSSLIATDAAHFLKHHLLPQFPFPIQRIQSDRGSEFIGREFQVALRDNKIKFRLNRPRAPHLNGKVEHYQRMDRMEFWSTIDNKAPRELLEEKLAEWMLFYNQQRTHLSLHCKIPYARLQELNDIVPSYEDVQAAYAPPQTIHHQLSWNVGVEQQYFIDNFLCNPHTQNFP